MNLNSFLVLIVHRKVDQIRVEQVYICQMLQPDSSSEIQTSTSEATSTAKATSGERKFSRMNLAVFLCAAILSASSYECKSLVEKGKNIC